MEQRVRAAKLPLCPSDQITRLLLAETARCCVSDVVWGEFLFMKQCQGWAAYACQGAWAHEQVLIYIGAKQTMAGAWAVSQHSALLWPAYRYLFSNVHNSFPERQWGLGLPPPGPALTTQVVQPVWPWLLPEPAHGRGCVQVPHHLGRSCQWNAAQGRQHDGQVSGCARASPELHEQDCDANACWSWRITSLALCQSMGLADCWFWKGWRGRGQVGERRCFLS